MTQILGAIKPELACFHSNEFGHQFKCVAVPSFRAEGGGWFRRWFPFARAPESREREERGGAVRLELQSSAPGAWGLDSFSSARPGGGPFLFKSPALG